MLTRSPTLYLHFVITCRLPSLPTPLIRASLLTNSHTPFTTFSPRHNRLCSAPFTVYISCNPPLPVLRTSTPYHSLLSDFSPTPIVRNAQRRPLLRFPAISQRPTAKFSNRTTTNFRLCLHFLPSTYIHTLRILPGPYKSISIVPLLRYRSALRKSIKSRFSFF